MQLNNRRFVLIFIFTYIHMRLYDDVLLKGKLHKDIYGKWMQFGRGYHINWISNRHRQLVIRHFTTSFVNSAHCAVASLTPDHYSIEKVVHIRSMTL